MYLPIDTPAPRVSSPGMAAVKPPDDAEPASGRKDAGEPPSGRKEIKADAG